MTSIRFYYDFISPNAYLAWTQLKALTEPFARPTELRPVLFAGLLKAHNRFGPAEIPPVRDWMFRNCVRKAAALGVPLNPPAHHPFNPLLPLRMVSAIVDPAQRFAWTDRFFRAVWVEAEDLSDRSAMARVCESMNRSPAEMFAAADSPEAKSQLRRETEEAIAAGVFGVPSLAIDGEIFWGYDDFPQAAQQLQGIDPLDEAAAKRWKKLSPSAVRSEASRER